MRRLLARTSSTGVLVLLIGACLGRTPDPALYRLSSTEAGRVPLTELPELSLAVVVVEFPSYLDRPEIMIRDGAHRLVPASGPAWGASLRSEVRRVVADDLAALLDTMRVAVHPAEPRFPVDYRVLLDVRGFEGAPGRAVTLHARWTILGRDDEPLALAESRIVQTTASSSWDAYAAAHSDALGLLTHKIAEKIIALEAR